MRSRLLYGCQSWDLREAKIKKFEACWHGFLRRMVNKGFRRKNDRKTADSNGFEVDMAYVYSNEDLVRITETVPLRNYDSSFIRNNSNTPPTWSGYQILTCESRYFLQNLVGIKRVFGRGLKGFWEFLRSKFRG